LKKIVANMTMGNDSASDRLFGLTSQADDLRIVSPLFPDIVQCMQIQVLEIKKNELIPLMLHSGS